MKKIYKQWTVKSFDLEKFDDEINSNIEIGWEIVEGSYLISDVDGKKVFSQVLVWKDDDENLELDFFYSDDNNTMTVIRNHNHNDENGTSTKIIWEKDFHLQTQWHNHRVVVEHLFLQ